MASRLPSPLTRTEAPTYNLKSKIFFFSFLFLFRPARLFFRVSLAFCFSFVFRIHRIHHNHRIHQLSLLWCYSPFAFTHSPQSSHSLHACLYHFLIPTSYVPFSFTHGIHSARVGGNAKSRTPHLESLPFYLLFFFFIQSQRFAVTLAMARHSFLEFT